MKQKHKSLTDSHSAFDDSSFSLTDDQAGASFIRSFQPATIAATAPDEIHPAAMPSEAPVGSMPAAISAQASLSGFTSVPITLGGITINLLFNVAAMSAPESFRQGIEQAATLLASAITDRITVNITIDYSGTGGGAMAKPIDVHSTVLHHRQARLDPLFGADLWRHPASHIIDPGTKQCRCLQCAGEALGTARRQRHHHGRRQRHLQYRYPFAAAHRHGASRTDSRVGPCARHLEIDTKVPNVFDLFRFTSPGVRLFQSSWDNAHPAPAAYFSVDGGFTRAADYGRV